MAFSATHRRRPAASRNLTDMGASASGAGQDADEEARRRLDAYTYLSAPERLEHVAINAGFLRNAAGRSCRPGHHGEAASEHWFRRGAPTLLRSGSNSW